MTKKLQDALNAIAESTDFPETLSTADLKGKTFQLNDIRTVDVDGEAKYIGIVEIDGEAREAWLTGSKLHRQVEALATSLPQTVVVTRGEGQYDPYLLSLA